MEQQESSGAQSSNPANLTQTTMATSNNNQLGDVSMTMNPPDLGLEKPSPSSTYPAKINNLIQPLGNQLKEAVAENKDKLQMTLPGGSGGGSILNKLRNQNEDDIKNKLMQATLT